MRGWIIVGLTLCAIVRFVTSANAQDVRDYMKVAPPAAWVEIQSVPDAAFPAMDALESRNRLLSYQHRVGKASRDRYTRYVYDLMSPNAIEDNGALDISFDPSYQSVVLHHAKIIRPGETRNLLDLDEFVVFRSETDRSKMMYNGGLTISLAIPGLRVGDRIDMAYGVNGKNPALGEGYTDFQTQAYSAPVQRLFSQTIVRDGLPVFTETLDGGEAPEVILEGRTTRVRFVKENIPAFTVDDDRPDWVYGWPIHRVSSYDNWAGVGNHFAQYYKRSNSRAVRDIARAIRAEHDTPEAQARAALDYVQSSIRYVALSMGSGGYIPRPPEKVLDRRYGDCKDVTLLLLSILEELDVEADPMLVDTEDRAAIFDLNPYQQAFNHVVVRAKVGDIYFVMDATRDTQLGDINHFDQGDFGKGLILRDGDSKVVTLETTDYPFYKDFQDEFDLVANPGSVSFKNTLIYYGEEADGIVAWEASDGLESITDSLANYMRDFYPTLTVKEPTQIDYDRDTARATLVTLFDIPKAWDPSPENKLQYFAVRPYEITADMPSFSGAERTTPFGLEYPVHVRQTTTLQVDDTYSFDNGGFEHEGDAFAFKEVNTFNEKASTYIEVYEYEAKQDHILPDMFQVDMAAVDDIRDRAGMTVQTPFEADVSASDSVDTPSWMQLVAAVFVVGLMGFLGWLFFFQGRTRET